MAESSPEAFCPSLPEDVQPLVNYCMASLSTEAQDLLRPHCRKVLFERDQLLAVSGQADAAVFFPMSGIVSIVYGEADADASIAMIGREGVANYHLLFPQSPYPYRAVGHVAGEAMCIGVDIMRFLLLSSRELRGMFYYFGAKLHLQIAATLRASLRDSVETRLARCLLMHQDRLGGDEVTIYHSAMADMLGVRRASITDAMHKLEGSRAIRDSRGQTRITDRKLLMEIAGPSYGAAEEIAPAATLL